MIVDEVDMTVNVEFELSWSWRFPTPTRLYKTFSSHKTPHSEAKKKHKRMEIMKQKEFKMSRMIFSFFPSFPLPSLPFLLPSFFILFYYV